MRADDLLSAVLLPLSSPVSLTTRRCSSSLFARRAADCTQDVEMINYPRCLRPIKHIHVALMKREQAWTEGGKDEEKKKYSSFRGTRLQEPRGRNGTKGPQDANFRSLKIGEANSFTSAVFRKRKFQLLVGWRWTFIPSRAQIAAPVIEFWICEIPL